MLRRLTVEDRDILMTLTAKANGFGDGAAGECATTGAGAAESLAQGSYGGPAGPYEDGAEGEGE